ncbi:hypothetical protein H5410_049620 [Solanum commersonii]|uniref:E3 ubiquitin-protein ligase RMA n=1 Tax=Solanum commersonii TaxID=4109 RepID=A0A9J5WT40_SOLCO|nr:hypothetical protein H5410_049620 [Solanum commersonii]
MHCFSIFLLSISPPITSNDAVYLRDSPSIISSDHTLPFSDAPVQSPALSFLFAKYSMALEQSFGEPIIGFGSDEDISLKKRNSFPVPMANPGNLMGCFDCNICLDSAHDPVVTLCGHLYCWPCIYKWLQVENSAPGSEETPTCPVCKSHISNSSLVPLYGRGASEEECRSNESQVDVVVPHRPQAIWTTATQVNTSSPPTSHVHQQLNHTSLYYPPPSIHHQQFFPMPLVAMQL